MHRKIKTTNPFDIKTVTLEKCDPAILQAAKETQQKHIRLYGGGYRESDWYLMDLYQVEEKRKREKESSGFLSK